MEEITHEQFLKEVERLKERNWKVKKIIGDKKFEELQMPTQYLIYGYLSIVPEGGKLWKV